MNKIEMERRLETAVSHAAPDDVKTVISRCEAQKGEVISMKKKSNKRAIRGLVAACLAILLLGGGGVLSYQQAHAIASIVSIDVNPSIELNVNKKGTILSCTPLNKEAREVLAEMNEGADLKGATLKVGVNAIIGALVQHGYLEKISSAILLSVEDKNTKRADSLQAELTSMVNNLLTEQSAKAAVLSQTVEQESVLKTLTTENEISVGKANLLSKIMEMNGTTYSKKDSAFKQLAALSVEELYDLLATRETRIPIGKDAAITAVAKYAGIKAESGVIYEVDAELDENPAHYEVEVNIGTTEYDYIVNAFTGEVIRGEQNIFSQGSKNPSDSQGGKTPASPEPTPSSPALSDIGRAKAKSIALNHSGLTESQITKLEIELDYDDGRLEYEIEFRSGGMEYDYTIDAATGKILEYDVEMDD